jgi:replicative DNA helicase
VVQAFDTARTRPLRTAPSGSRVPPHDLEAEESLLGAMLLSADATSVAIEICGAEDFYKPAHGHIFSAIVHLYERGEAIDAVTVSDELKRMGRTEITEDAGLLISLQANTPSTANARQYANIVEELSLLRRLIGVAAEVSELGYSMPEDVTAAVDQAEQMVFDLSHRRTSDTMVVLRDLMGPSLDRIDELAHRTEAITGTATGYHELDDILAGLQPSSLTIVGARPAMGKTSFALGMLAHVGVDLRLPSLLFSLEMGHLELCQRLLASEAHVDAQRLRTGRLHDNEFQKLGTAVARLDSAPIYIDDNPTLTIMDIRARARRLKKTEGALGLVIVDYLQLMTSRSRAENRQVEVAEISRGLKILARELEAPVVALSQLSRGLEARQDKRPMLSDLRESGSLEQDADVVLFIYREEQYGETPVERQGDAEIIVAKHRNGPTGSAHLVFASTFARFDNRPRI